MTLHLAGYTFRTGTRSDAAEFQTLIDLDRAFFEAMDGAPPRPDEAAHWWDEVPPCDEQRCLFVTRDGDAAPLGILELLVGYPDAQTWFLGLIYLAPSARGAGLGTQILDALFAELLASGAHALRLAVVHDHTRARRLYERIGFEFVDRRTRLAWSGVRTELDVLERVRPALAAGQVWRYAARACDDGSRVTVLRIEELPHQPQRVAQIAVDGVRLASGERTTMIAPIDEANLCASLRELVETGAAPPASFAECYARWRPELDAGHAGVYHAPVARIAELVSRPPAGRA